MIKTKQNSDKNEIIQIIVATVIIACILIPLLVLTRYSGPSADDFGNTNRILSQNGNSFIQKAMMFFSEIYKYSQGTYFGTFLCFLAPFLFSINGFPLANFFNMIIFFACLFYFIRVLFSVLFNCKAWSVTLWTYLAAIFLMTQFTNPSESFYWFTGFAFYTFPASFGFLAFAFLFKAFHYSTVNKTKMIIFTCVCGFFSICAIGGILFLPAIFGVVLLAFTIWTWIKKHPFKMPLTILFFVCDIFIALNVFAPGYHARAESYTWRTDFSIPSVCIFNLQVINDIFTKLIPVAIFAVCFALIIPFIRATKNSSFSFSHPILAVFGTAILIFCTVFPNSYGEGSSITVRYTNAAVWTIALSFICLTLYIVGYLVKNHQLSFKNINNLYVQCAIVIFAFFSMFTIKPFRSFVSFEIVSSFIGNGPQTAKAEELRIFNEIKTSTQSDVVIQANGASHPYLMGVRLFEEPENWFNTVVADYYDKSSVSLVPAS